MNDTDFTLIRHGQTEANIKGILQGHLDVPLNETGRLQARCAAERLKNEKFDLLISSDLIRAAETAEIIGAVLQLSPVLLPDLREWHLGELEGKESSSLWNLYPEIMDSFNFDNGQDIRVPGGESKFQFFERVSGCLDSLAAEYTGKRILLVSHGGTSRAIFRHIAGPPRKGCMIPKTDNASFSRFFKRGDFWQLNCWNDVSHLKDVQHKESITY